MTNENLKIPKINLRSNINILFVIAKKDWKVYWRYPFNAVTAVFNPLIWLAPIFFLGKAFSQDGQALGFAGYSGSTDYMSFLIISAVISNFISTVFWGMGYSLKNDMDAGVLESNWMAPINRLLLLVGRSLNNLFITTITSILMVILAALMFGFHPTGNLLAAILTLLPMLLGLYGFGFAFAALVMIMREANTMVDMGSFLVDLLSGSQFPVNALPRWLLPIALSIPLTYGFDAVRGWLLKTKTILPMHQEINLMLIFMVLMIIIGIIAFTALERKVRAKGTLGQY
ncbi:MAG: ABC transporter permease [Anaerolineaceae bacterium]|nr:ABC transporter permease [Anaerolineaceae bacterium]